MSDKEFDIVIPQHSETGDRMVDDDSAVVKVFPGIDLPSPKP